MKPPITDDWGGVLVEDEPTYDDWGGVLVEDAPAASTLTAPEDTHTGRTDAARGQSASLLDEQLPYPDLDATELVDSQRIDPPQNLAADIGGSLVRGGLEQGLYAGAEGATRGLANKLEPTAFRVAKQATPDVLSAELESNVARQQQLLGEGKQATVLHSPMMGAMPGDAPKVARAGDPELDTLQTREHQLREALKFKQPGASVPVSETLRGVAEDYAGARETVRESLPVSPQFERSLPGQIVSGLGQAAGTLPTYVIPGFGQALSLGQMYDEAYQDAKSKGASEEKAHEAAATYLPATALDVVADKFLLGKVLRGAKGKTTVGRVLDVLKGTAVEGGTEGLQQGYLNTVAKYLSGYDPDRELDDEVITSAIVGAAVGSGVAGVGQALNAQSKRIQRVADERAARLEAAGAPLTAEAIREQAAAKADALRQQASTQAPAPASGNGEALIATAEEPEPLAQPISGTQGPPIAPTRNYAAEAREQLAALQFTEVAEGETGLAIDPLPSSASARIEDPAAVTIGAAGLPAVVESVRAQEQVPAEETAQQDPTRALAEPELATPPTLRPGERGTGEMFQGGDQPFNLAGERGIDWQRRQQEQDAAAREAAEAQAQFEREQQELFAQYREEEAEHTVELSDALQRAGGLPTRRSPHFSEWSGELAALQENRRGARESAQDRRVFTNLFRNDAPSLDTVAESLREDGFNVETADDVFRLVDEWLRTGKEPRAAARFQSQREEQAAFFDQPSADAEAVFERARRGDESAFDELDAIKRARLGEPPSGRGRQDRAARFRTPDEFEAFFNRAYGVGDFDAVAEAVKASDKAVYVPVLKKFIRTEPDKAEWLRAVFVGSRPPNAAPPKAKAPGPAATTTATPPSPRAQSTANSGQTNFSNMPPPAPPPMPPRPQGKSPFNVPAMVHLARAMGENPVINRLLRRARGRYVADATGRRVELNPDLFKNPEQAAKTLAHEIGHAIDFITLSVKHAGLAKKVAPLKNWQQIFGPLWNWSGKKISRVQQLLKAEAIAVSTAWRGPFSPQDKYRNSSVELYADFLSALLNDPDWTFTAAPRLSHAFFAGLQQKPEAEAAYNLVNDLLKTDMLLPVLQQQATAKGRAAVRKTLHEAIERNSVQMRAAKVARQIYGAFFNRFGVAAMKAGGYWKSRKDRLARFGADYVTKQEQARLFARREIALMEDSLRTRVYRPLESSGVSDADFARVLLNTRIVEERTATAQYLQQEPDEFRQLLLWMADEAGLATWLDRIENATDAELYPLGAKLVFELHQQDRFDSVLKAAQRKGAPDFAERGLFAFDVSGFMLNPQGFTPADSDRDNVRIEKELGPARWSALKEAQRAYYDIMAGIAREANSLGLFRPETWSERIAPNLENYVPFMVLDYFSGDVSAALQQRRGTSKDVLPVHLAGALKAAALLRRMAYQQGSLLLRDFFTTDGKAHGFADEMSVEEKLTPQDIQRIEKQGGGVRGYWDKGAWKWLKFTDGDMVKVMEEVDLSLARGVWNMAQLNSNFWRTTFTVYSIGFQISNLKRQLLTTFERQGMRGVYKLATSLPIAREYARAVFGGEMSPEIRRLVEEGVLPPPQQHIGADVTEPELVDMILRGVVTAEQMKKGLPFGKVETALRKHIPLAEKALDFLTWISAHVESVPKIAAEQALKVRGVGAEEAAAFARLEGIPNPGVVGGKWSPALEPALMFARVHLQGMRATLTYATHPRTRGAFLLRVGLRHAVTKSLYVMAGAGLLDAVANSLSGGDDEDKKKQVDLQEWVRRTTPYKLENDDALFLGWMDSKGGYHAPYGHSAIPADWTPINFRLGFSEEGRYVAPLSALTLFTLADTAGMNTGISPVKPTQRYVGVLKSFIPSSNPLLGIGWNMLSFTDDAPPRDDYRGRPIATQDEWNAGLTSRAWALTRHALAQTPVRGVVTKSDRGNDSLPPVMDALMRVPGAKTLIAADNYQGVREEQRERAETDRVEASAREMRGPYTKRAVSRYFALQRKEEGKRTSAERKEFNVLKLWYYSEYAGTSRAPGNFAALKAKAAGRKNVDADRARERMEETAKNVLGSTAR